MKKARVSVGGAILLILALSSGEYATTVGHFLAQFDGVVAARTNNVAYPSWTRNLTTRYVIQEPDGRKCVYYADPSEGDLGGFKIGTHLSKQRWHMVYEADGKVRNDFPLPLYLFWMVFDFGIFAAVVVLAIRIRTRDQRTRDLEAAVERGQELLRQTEDRTQ
jgi:hypothetical protein